MSLTSRSWFRGLAAASAAIVFTVAGGSAALADNVVVDGDVVTTGTQSTLSVGAIACGVPTTKTVGVFVSRSGSGTNVFANSAVVDITASSGSSAVAAAIATGSVGDVDLPSNWEAQGNPFVSEVVTASITVTSSTAGSGSTTVRFTGRGLNVNGSVITRITSPDLTVSWTTGSCAPTKTATATTVSCPSSVTFDGAAQTPCTALTTGSGGFSQNAAVSYTVNTNAGVVTASAAYSGSDTRLPSDGSATFQIAKAPSTTTVACPASVTWTGSAQTPCTASVTGAGGLNEPLTPTYTENTAVGTATASASFGGDANHTASSASKAFDITKTGSTVTVTCDSGPFTYTGSAHTPCSATVTGAGGLSASVAVTYEANTDAGTATATATYAGDASHAAATGSKTFVIGRATATCLVPDVTVIYDGGPHRLSGTCTGLGGADLSSGFDPGESFTNAGEHAATWTFEGGVNYADLSGSGTVTIGRTAPECTVTAYHGPYTATPHGASGSCVGIDGEELTGLTPGASFTDVPGGTAEWSIPASTNYTAASGSVTVVITPAGAVCDVIGYDGVYDAAARGATGSCSGISGRDAGTLELGASFTDVPGGTAEWSFTGNGNYADQGGTVAITIGQAASTVSVICDPAVVTYDATAQEPCSASASGVGLSPVPLTVAYLGNVDAGIATATASWPGDDNHDSSSGSDTFEILRAPSSVMLLCTDPVTYTGVALEVCSATASGVGIESPIELVVDYTDNMDAGTADASAAWEGDRNHEGSSKATTFTILAAPSVTTVSCPTSVTFDGSAQEPCSATASGAGLDEPIQLAVNYTDNTNVGTANASAAWAGDPNHTSSTGSATFEITQAATTTVVTCPAGPFVYTGSPLTPACTATTTGTGLTTVHPSVTFTNNTNAGTATASASYPGDDNHLGSTGSTTFVIDQASSTVSLLCTDPVTYTGEALEVCSATASGAGIASPMELEVDYTDNTDVGTADASAAWAGDANHTGSSGSATFEITQAATTTVVTCPDGPFVYTGSPLTPSCTATTTGAGLTTVHPAVTFAGNTDAGTATASASYTGDANHTGSSGSQTFTIDQADSVTTVSCPTSVTFDGSAHEPCTATATGAGDLEEAVAVTYENNVHAGTATASATYAGDDNHTGSTGSATFEITQAATTTVVTCPAGPFVYTGSPLTPACTATTTGAGLTTVHPSVTFTNNTNAGTATASASYPGDDNHLGSTGSTTFVIDQASSTVTVLCTDPVTYTGEALDVCSATASGAGIASPIELEVDYTDNTDVGTADASAAWAGDANHTGSTGSAAFEITKADSVTAVSCPASVTFTGSALTPCSATVTGTGGLDHVLTVSYGDNVHAGTATASAVYAGDANHEPSENSTTFEIDKAATTTVVTCPAGPYVYTGEPLTPECTATTTGDGLTTLHPAVTFADNTNAGTATASASYGGDGDHLGSTGSATFVIDQASSTVTLICTDPVTYTGEALEVCSATADGDGIQSPIQLVVDYTDNTNVGTANASAAWEGDDNHISSGNSKSFEITKADSVTTMSCPASVTFSGSALTPCTAKVTGAGGLNQMITVSHGDNTHAGTATASASYAGDANHEPSDGSATFEIDQAPTTTTVTCTGGPFVYTGSPITPACTATTTGAGLTTAHPSVSLASNTNAGTATASASFPGDPDHLASTGSTTFTIDKAPTTVTVTCPGGPFVYTGSAYTPCSATVSGAGRPAQGLVVSYVGNINPGTATASASYAGDANHLGGTASATFQIAAWTLKGFYQPVDMNGVWNTVKGGSTVPLKFEVFAGATELTATSAVKSFVAAKVSCSTGTEDAVETFTTTGGTTLRYDSTGGQFIQNWQTPKLPGACYKVTMTTQDGSSLSALFKLK